MKSQDTFAEDLLKNGSRATGSSKSEVSMPQAVAGSTLSAPVCLDGASTHGVTGSPHALSLPVGG
ncbi:MAG TPA: hypothetical protein VGD98_22660 [Ktedonobacteraceae bacterium]